MSHKIQGKDEAYRRDKAEVQVTKRKSHWSTTTPCCKAYWALKLTENKGIYKISCAVCGKPYDEVLMVTEKPRRQHAPRVIIINKLKRRKRTLVVSGCCGAPWVLVDKKKGICTLECDKCGMRIDDERAEQYKVTW